MTACVFAAETRPFGPISITGAGAQHPVDHNQWATWGPESAKPSAPALRIRTRRSTASSATEAMGSSLSESKTAVRNRFKPVFLGSPTSSGAMVKINQVLPQVLPRPLWTFK